MKPLYFIIVFLSVHFTMPAQSEFHVFPEDHAVTPGSKSGNGSLLRPWDLQTALSQPPHVVNGGDVIWLHKGIYNGRFISRLNNTKSKLFITVAGFKSDKVVLNGNVPSNKKFVLEVQGKNVILKDFQITWLGDFPRIQSDPGFKLVDGLSHNSGIDCKFINLVIYNNPGSGFGSWKHTGGSVIEGCTIYNNGYMSKSGRGSGVGIYVQNNSDKTRLITNNIIFNNYYKGIEVWSDNSKATNEYVKNVKLTGNIIFNNGSPSGQFRDNLIIGSNDRNGINIAKHILVDGNIFYHNTDFANNQVTGNAASLTLGYNAKAPIEDVTVSNNIIVGHNNALRILHARTLRFNNNISYCGYVHFNRSVVHHLNDSNWKFNNNTYFTKNSRTFRISKFRDFTFNNWQSEYNIDLGSQGQHISHFNLKNVLILSKDQLIKNKFRMALFSKEGKEVSVDFSKYDIPKGSTYIIKDVENPGVSIKTGKIGNDSIIFVPMGLDEFEGPIHNDKAKKTLHNFGVYTIEFYH